MTVRSAVVGVLAFSLLGCGSSTEWYRRLSAGSVGCARQEIEIRDETSNLSGQTWTAVCRGRAYYCAKNEEGLIVGHRESHDAKCTAADGGAVTSAAVSGPSFVPGISTKQDEFKGRTTLRVMLGTTGLRANCSLGDFAAVQMLFSESAVTTDLVTQWRRFLDDTAAEILEVNQVDAVSLFEQFLERTLLSARRNLTSGATRSSQSAYWNTQRRRATRSICARPTGTLMGVATACD